MLSKGKGYPALLGREWLHGTRAIQDWDAYTFTLRHRGKSITMPMVNTGFGFMKEEDNASSTTASSESTASSYSESTYHCWMAGDPYEPTNEGELNIDSEADSEEFVTNWLHEAYELNQHSCFHLERRPDIDEEEEMGYYLSLIHI